MTAKHPLDSPRPGSSDGGCPQILFLGANFETGNLGVNALAASTVRCILSVYPNAEILFRGKPGEPETFQHRCDGISRTFRRVAHPPSSNKYWRKELLRDSVYFLLLTLLPFGSIKRRIINTSPLLKSIHESPMVADITGGDSFADIYGFKRFVMAALPKALVLKVGTPLVLLPQTLGPFNGRFSLWVAKWILRKAKLVYSRDQESRVEARKWLGNDFEEGKFRFCNDVAFALPPQLPTDSTELSALKQAINPNHLLVGMNVSGLLYRGGYTRDNMFSLKADYRQLVLRITEWLLEQENITVLLVPHVFKPLRAVESDQGACREIMEALRHRYSGRLFTLEQEYDEGEIKHIIGQCGFFLGSRMHSCIAALSQGIPTVPIAYSRKFLGVLSTIDMQSLVVDPRTMSIEEIMSVVEKTFSERVSLAKKLEQAIPAVRQRVLKLFEEIGQEVGLSGEGK